MGVELKRGEATPVEGKLEEVTISSACHQDETVQRLLKVQPATKKKVHRERGRYSLITTTRYGQDNLHVAVTVEAFDLKEFCERTLEMLRG